MKSIFTKTDLENISLIRRKQFKQLVKSNLNNKEHIKSLILDLALTVINWDNRFIESRSIKKFFIEDIDKIKSMLELLE